MDPIKLRGLILFIIAFLNFALALFIWSKAKGDKNKFWLGVTAASSGLFAFVCGGSFFFFQEYSIITLYWWRATWLGVLILPPFNIFTYYFIKNTKNVLIKGILFYVGALLIIYLSLTTTFLIGTLHPSQADIFSGSTGPLDSLARIYILFGLTLALVNLFRGYIRTDGKEKLQLKYFIWGTAIFAISGIFTSITPFILKNSAYYDMPAYLSFIWVAFITYAVFKYNVFNIKVFANELLIFGTGILLFIRIIVSESYIDLISNIVLAILLTALGMLFLKSIYKERELDRKLLEETRRNLDLEQRLRNAFAQVSGETLKKMGELGDALKAKNNSEKKKKR